MLMRGLSAQLLLFPGDNLTIVNNDRASASNAQMLSTSAISKCLKLKKFKVKFSSPFRKFRIIPLPQKLKFTCQQSPE